jgi:3-phenylpropionate/cinnamic acid dioxygenase small subunit
MNAVVSAEMLFRIVALNADYAAAIDDDRLEDWPSFFLEECVYKITSADNLRDGNEAGIVYADSRSMLADRVLALRRANIYERQTYRHIVGTPRLLGSDAVDIRVEAPFLVVRTMRDGRMDLFATGRYRDRLHDHAGELRFQERIVICDSSHFDTLVAIPL